MSEIPNREAIAEVLERYDLDPNMIAQDGFTPTGWFIFVTDNPRARRFDENGDPIKVWVPNRQSKLRDELAALLD